MIGQKLANRVGRFLLDRLLLWIIIAMIVTIVAMMLLLPQRRVFTEADSPSVQWPASTGR